MLAKHRAESRLGFLRPSHAELQPRNPQPDLDVAGVSATIRSKAASASKVCPERASCSATSRFADGDWAIRTGESPWREE
jgi:hypothetical protein